MPLAPALAPAMSALLFVLKHSCPDHDCTMVASNHHEQEKRRWLVVLVSTEGEAGDTSDSCAAATDFSFS